MEIRLQNETLVSYTRVMREQDRHFHADSFYQATGSREFYQLAKNIFEFRFTPGKLLGKPKEERLSLNVHLPFELQHPKIYVNHGIGLSFIHFGETLRRMVGIQLFWENSPELNVGTWDLKFDQTEWELIPREGMDLCLDTGHLMLGSSSPDEAQRRIQDVLADRGPQIKHLHIHENDLVSDQHLPIGTIITSDLFQEMVQNRSYIFEKPS